MRHVAEQRATQAPQAPVVDSDEGDWLVARDDNRLPALRGYVLAHPGGEHVGDALTLARSRIRRLTTGERARSVTVTTPVYLRELPSSNFTSADLASGGSRLNVIDSIRVGREVWQVVEVRGRRWPFRFVQREELELRSERSSQAPTTDLNRRGSQAPTEAESFETSQIFAPQAPDLDSVAWRRVQGDNLMALREYLLDWPNGMYVNDALEASARRIQALRREFTPRTCVINAPLPTRELPTHVEETRFFGQANDAVAVRQAISNSEGMWYLLNVGGRWPYRFVLPADLDVRASIAAQPHSELSMRPFSYRRRAGERGASEPVRLALTISNRGEVTQVQVISDTGVHQGFLEAAVREARGWWFTPASRCGQPVLSTRTIRVDPPRD